MNKTSRIAMTVCASLIWMAGVAQARPPRPTKYVKQQVTAVRTLLKIKPATPAEGVELDTKLKAVVSPVIDFKGMSKRALRKHWDGLNEEQRSTFVTLFQDLVFESYLSQVRSADEQYTIKYEDEEEKGDKGEVTAIAKTAKAEVELVFKLDAKDGKTWVTRDVVIDEVSLEENYREQFNQIIAKDGFEELLNKMRKKLDKLRGKKGGAAAPEKAPEAPKK
ncbi:MAG: phospholipid-binding protein MlaC [Bradymonadia bacterium]